MCHNDDDITNNLLHLGSCCYSAWYLRRQRRGITVYKALSPAPSLVSVRCPGL